MGEKIIEAKFKKNIVAYGVGILAVVLVIISAVLMISQYDADNTHYKIFYYSDLSIGEYISDRIISTYFGMDVLILFWSAVFLLVVFGVMMLMMNFCALEVSGTSVTGKTSFGKRVDLPINQVSAIGMGWFSSITVATSSGKINFWLIQNREEIHKVLSGLIENIQVNNKPSVSVNNSLGNADELIKFKTLLDNGAITQEEYDAKKKELLGL